MKKITRIIASLVIVWSVAGASIVLPSITATTYAQQNIGQGIQGGEYEKARTQLGGTNSNAADSSQRVINIIAGIVRFVLGFSGLILTLLILYAGFLWMTARGDSKQVEKAQAYLKNAAIGLVILLSATGLSVWVFNQLYKTITTPGR